MDGGATVWATAVLWLYITFLAFWGIQWWLGRHIQGLVLLITNRTRPASTFYFYLLAPGVVLHEISHWLMARVLFVPTRDVALFRPQPAEPKGGPKGQKGQAQGGPVTLGYVEIFKTDPVRQSLIGLAPLPVGILVLLLLAALLNFNTGINPVSPQDDSVWQSISRLPTEFAASVQKPLNFLWLYLVFTVSNGMLPSKPDRRPWLFGLILPGALILVLAVTGILPPLPQDWQQTLRQLMGNLTWIFAFAAAINLVLALVIFLLELLVSRFKRRRVVYK
ncbi:MAG: hypothetical protein J0I20_21620 [Chloroflexi bacterium]|nr:hypothetical protein [Chloroflexota bacterium]OJV99845.1 MAG: hypothetical protein BGO39_29135 [Chloroflexi bacterium 54-19]